MSDKELIDALLKDDRLDYLMITPEFRFAKFRLLLMQCKIEDGDLPERDTDFLRLIEEKIKNICVRLEPGIVDGEECQILFITKVIEPAQMLA